MGWWPLFILFQDGTLIDDYRQAYGWLRQNTASDARIMAWWDYGALARTRPQNRSGHPEPGRPSASRLPIRLWLVKVSFFLETNMITSATEPHQKELVNMSIHVSERRVS